MIVSITWSVVYLFHYGFSRLYLQLPKLLPVWDKIWAALVLVDIVSGVMLVKMVFAAGEFSNVAPGPFFKLASFRVLANLPLLLTILMAAAAAWFKGNKGAGIYLAAMLTYVLQEFANNVNAWFGFLNLPSYVYGYVGQTLMVLLFAMGIARQLKALQEEKSAAEQAQLAERAENTRIRELDAFKSRFYTNITHQFRTPLTIILGDEKAKGHEQYTVLLVEDNRDVVEYISTVLSSRFHLVAEYDGQQGLARALILIPDIIISDIMTPAMDGLEMSRQLKADRRTSHIPIILLTAKADIASRIEGLRTGADAYLAKPFAPEELQAQIDNLIELRARLQELYRDLSFLFQPQHTLPDEDIHSEDHFMRELHGLIRDNLSDPDFSIGQLCEQIGISRASLYKKFKALSNQSIADFIRRVRLHRARQLLETTSLNVTQVAIEVGFKNLSTFSRNFTEEFGVNPRGVKKEHKI